MKENLILIDTNILRQLGLRFYDHIDYKNLLIYLYPSTSSLVIPDTVFAEYIDYYKQDVIDRHINNIAQVFDKLRGLEHFSELPINDFSDNIKEQIEFITEKLKGRTFNPRYDSLLTEKTLLEFLIHNKREQKKDNTRDFLIWLNALGIAKSHKEDVRVILISEDQIFIKNSYFLEFKRQQKVDNLFVYNSIPSFLNEVGFQSKEINEESILKVIPLDIIKQELLADKNAIPSYISRFYYNSRRTFTLEEFKINGDITIESFYAHKDMDTKAVEVIAHIHVPVKMIFEPEPEIQALKTYLDTPDPDKHYLETFDNRWRPIYEELILFIFKMNFDENTHELKNVEFIDFDPSEYQIRRYRTEMEISNWLY